MDSTTIFIERKGDDLYVGKGKKIQWVAYISELLPHQRSAFRAMKLLPKKGTRIKARVYVNTIEARLISCRRADRKVYLIGGVQVCYDGWKKLNKFFESLSLEPRPAERPADEKWFGYYVEVE